MVDTRRLVARSALVLILAFAVMGLLWAAGGQEAGEDADAAAMEPDQVTLMLDWVSNVNHVGIYVARDMGFFANHGLDVRIIEPGEVYATSAVVGGQADFGIDFQENITLLRADDVPIVSIAAILQTNTSGFAVRPGEGIDGPADFEGLVYGTFNSPFEEPTLSTLVRCAGGSPESIKYVTAGTDLLAMLSAGLADIVWIYYGTQGFQAERVGVDIDYFPLNDYSECIPDYYTPVVIASERTLGEKPELTRRFLAALAKAHEYVVANPSEAARVLSAAVPELDSDELASSVPWLAQRMLMGKPWGYQEYAVWEEYGEWMAQAGVLDGSFDPALAFTTEFLPTP
jgi:NitT/TauT family transport system substrate-binding protein